MSAVLFQLPLKPKQPANQNTLEAMELNEMISFLMALSENGINWRNGRKSRWGVTSKQDVLWGHP